MEDAIFTVEKLVQGGDGIVRRDERAVFVPFVIPGERVKIRPTGARKPPRAELTEVMHPSLRRVEPPCPLFTRCGGCRFQHIQYEAQLEYKRDILAETIRRIAKLEPEVKPMTPSPKEYNYRSRIRLHVKEGKAGFFGPKKERFFPVDYCRLAEEGINNLLPQIPSLLEKHRPRSIEVALTENGEPAAVAEFADGLRTFRRKGAGGMGKKYEWSEDPGWKPVFRQVNRGQNINLRKTVSELVENSKPDDVIELYAGAGNLTGAIMPHCRRITAVDSDAEAVKLARLKFGHIPGGDVKVVRRRAANFLERAKKEKTAPDLVLLDPPRSGAKEAVPGMLALSPRHIIYVSCDPATLARDIRSLHEGGYEARSVLPLDMFPQTAHIESVTLLERVSSS